MRTAPALDAREREELLRLTLKVGPCMCPLRCPLRDTRMHAPAQHKTAHSLSAPGSPSSPKAGRNAVEIMC
jgi:hypothetical protein